MIQIWEGYLVYLRGMFFGAIMTIIGQLIIIYSTYTKFMSKPFTSKQTTPPSPAKHEPSTDTIADNLPRVPHKHLEPWPIEIFDFLFESLKETNDGSTANETPTETCHWLNVVSQRYFLELKSSELFKHKTKSKISENINLRLKGNTFVSRVELKDIDLGQHAPKLHSVRLIKGLAEDYAVTCEFDVTYVGGANITVETWLTAGFSLNVKVYLTELAGKVRIRCPSIKWSDMLCISFTEDPGANFVVDSPITVRENQMVKDIVNKLLAKVVKKAFLETWVEPHWRSFYLPLMQPYPKQVLERSTLRPSPGVPLQKETLERSPSRHKAKLMTDEPIHVKKLAIDFFSDSLFSTASVLLESDIASHSEALLDAFELIIKNFLQFAGKSSFPTSVTATSDAVGPVSPVDTESNEGKKQTSTTHSSTIATPTSDSFTTNNNNSNNSDYNSKKSNNNSKKSDNSDFYLSKTLKSHLDWKLFKSKNGINLYKARDMTSTGQETEFYCVDFEIECPAEQVNVFLSNPRHYSQINENHLGFNILDQIDANQCVIHGTFSPSKNTKMHYLVYQIKRQLVKQEEFVVVSRSVEGFGDETSQKYGKLPPKFPIYLSGYWIKRQGSSTRVLAFSNMCAALSKFNMGISQAKNIKNLLEQVKAFALTSSHHPDFDQIDVYRQRPVSASASAAPNIEKLKNVLNSTTNYLLKTKTLASTTAWIGSKLGSSSSTNHISSSPSTSLESPPKTSSESTHKLEIVAKRPVKDEDDKHDSSDGAGVSSAAHGSIIRQILTGYATVNPLDHSHLSPTGSVESLREYAITPREVYRVTVLNDKTCQNNAHLCWEFSCKQDFPIQFSISFTTETDTQLIRASEELVLIDKVAVNAYQCQCYGGFQLGSVFPSGKFNFVFENTYKLENLLFYSVWITNEQIQPSQTVNPLGHSRVGLPVGLPAVSSVVSPVELPVNSSEELAISSALALSPSATQHPHLNRPALSIDFVVNRKCTVYIPFLYNKTHNETLLQYEYNTFHQEIGFGVEFRSYDDGKEASGSPGVPTESRSSVASKLTALVVQAPLVNRYKQVLAINKRASKGQSLKGVLPASESSGIYYFVFDNSQFLFANRRIKLEVWVK